MRTILIGFLLAISPVTAQQQLLDSADHYIDTKQYHKAKELLLQRAPNSPSMEMKEKLADVHGHLKEWDQAIPLYRELTTEYGDNANFHFKYGGAVGRKAQSVSRIKALTMIGTIKKSFLRANQLDAQHISSRWGLIEYYLAVPAILGGGLNKAFAPAKELLQILPIEGHFALAYLYSLDEEPQKAKQHYKKALGYIPGLGTVERNQLHFLIGKLCGEYNSYLNQGIAHMQTFINNHSVKDGAPLSEAYYRMAKLYRLKKERAKADFWIKKALQEEMDFELALAEQKIIENL